MAKTTQPVEELSYEKALGELETILDALEEGKQSVQFAI